jgi:hypothetical protein
MQDAMAMTKTAVRVMSSSMLYDQLGEEAGDGDGMDEGDVVWEGEEEDEGKVMLWTLTGVMSGYLSMMVGLTRIR